MESDHTSIRRGLWVFACLAVATAVEFVVAVTQIPGAVLMILVIALTKAWLIAVYFMHIRRLRGAG
jgi:caa(3)-type oxidase subunit IV